MGFYSEKELLELVDMFWTIKKYISREVNFVCLGGVGGRRALKLSKRVLIMQEMLEAVNVF